MSIIDKENGHMILSATLSIKPFADYNELLIALQKEALEIRNEEHYSMFQFINIFKYKADNKSFHFELYFDKNTLKSINFNFSCDKGYEISYEQWMLNEFGTQQNFEWGNLELGEHPKFGVPLISIRYNISKL